MSLKSRTARNTITIERLSSTPNDTGGQTRTWSTAARGSLPSSIACRIVPLRSDERIAYGVRGSKQVWKFLFSSDPQITVVDRIRFNDPSGVEHIATILETSLDIDFQGRLYRAVGSDSENEG